MLHTSQIPVDPWKRAPLRDSRAHPFASETRSLPQHVAVDRVKTHLRQRATMLHEFEDLGGTVAATATKPNNSSVHAFI